MVVWPGDSNVEIKRTMDLENGDITTVSTLSMGAHTGTHMDAPLHFLAGGQSLDELPFDAVIGPARVLPISNSRCIALDELQAHDLRPGERILFRTSNSDRCWRSDSFVEEFAYVSADAARYLVERGIRTVGIDYLSVGGYEVDMEETHRILLEAGVWIIEGLDLSHVEPGDYELFCLPLKIAGGEGAPARAVLRRSTSV